MLHHSPGSRLRSNTLCSAHNHRTLRGRGCIINSNDILIEYERIRARSACIVCGAMRNTHTHTHTKWMDGCAGECSRIRAPIKLPSTIQRVVNGARARAARQELKINYRRERLRTTIHADFTHYRSFAQHNRCSMCVFAQFSLTLSRSLFVQVDAIRCDSIEPPHHRKRVPLWCGALISGEFR